MEPPTPTENPPFGGDQRKSSTTNSHANGSAGPSQPSKIQTTFTSQQHRNQNQHNPAFVAKLREMSLALAPFVQLTTGQVHPAFPPTLLHFWLLTDDQLDALAQFYHQATPCEWTRHYPCPITWPPGLTLEEKRRKIGKFIGLRGCETPLTAVDEHGRLVWGRTKTEEEIAEDARRARMASSEEEEVRRKMGWY